MFNRLSRFTDIPAGIVTAVFLFVLGILSVSPFASAADDYLQPEVAFKFSAKMIDAETIEVRYVIADGYYMYREPFNFKATGAQLGVPDIPSGKIKFDDTFQKDVETYRNSITIRLPVQSTGPFTLTAVSQGCADKGLCYSPMESQATLSPGGGGLLAAVQGAVTENTRIDTPAAQSKVSLTDAQERSSAIADSDMGRIEAALKGGQWLAILPLFLLLGLGLSFTPCVLPMMPILSSIIVGEGGRANRARGFMLAATYSLGMAIVYTALGIAAGLLGEGLSATLQNPWILIGFALLMVALALSMFGVYRVQMPAVIQAKLMRMSERQTAGKQAGVFAMGALSALIVGPCVAAPLAGALIYISQTRDVVIGGGALFAMAVGMSVPLLLVGVSAGTLLPRAGAWMVAINRFFGVLLLGLALWMVSPVIPVAVQMLGWAALGIGYGAYLLWARNWGWVAKALGLVFAVLGLVQLVGVGTGGRDAFAPLAHLSGNQHKKPEFTRIKSTADLDRILTQSRGKTVLLDFYADWCVSCVEMERFTFTDPRVRSQLDNMVLLQVDVTANDADDKAMLKRFKLFGPPGIVFFNGQGTEIEGGRVIGFQNADKFLQSLALVNRF
jgi:thiol:disulfide interchange protein DsbD